MNALSDKVYVRFHALIIETFKFTCEVTEKTVEVTVHNRMVMENMDASHEFTEIQPIFMRQKMSKKGGTKAIDILLVFPSFIASIDLLCRVLGCLSKRGRYERYCPHHHLSVSFPKCIILIEHSPVPS